MISYANSIKARLLNQRVEIFCGDSRHTQYYNDYQIEQKSVIRGILREVEDECLIVEVSGENGGTNLIYLNTFCVIAVLKPQGGISITDCYCDESSKQPK